MFAVEQLHAWIAESQRTQKRMLRLGGALTFAGLGSRWFGTGGFGLVCAALGATLAVAGYWVTASHIADWRMQLEIRTRKAR